MAPPLVAVGLVLVALGAGPFFSWSGLDARAHLALRRAGLGRQLATRGGALTLLDAVFVGTPYWVLVSEALLRPLVHGTRVPVAALVTIALGYLVKVYAQRAWIWEDGLEESSRWWSPSARRLVSVKGYREAWYSSAFPSLHTATMVALAFHDPALWAFAPLVAAWMVAANHHWVSDVVGGALLAIALAGLG